MDAKKMFLALVLIATIAVIPSFATFEKDFITTEAIQAVLKRRAPLSNIMLEEDAMNALIKSKTVNDIPCGDECVERPCVQPVDGGRCYCKKQVCYYKSLDM